VAEGLPLLLRIYRLAMTAATPIAPLLLSYRLRSGKEDRSRLAERRGQPAIPRPAGPLIWLHGASVGEITAVLPLIERVRAEGFQVLVTSGTVTSAELAQQRLPAGAIHQYVPHDAPPFVDAFLNHWHPDLALFVESDLWPNLVLGCADRKIPLLLLNGRLSHRSFSRWKLAPRAIRTLLRRFELCLTQSPTDAERYAKLGGPRVIMTGNLKLDVPAPPANFGELQAIKATTEDRTVIAAASTHPGEETAIIDAHRRLSPLFPGLLTIIVPRHPNRGHAVAELASSAGLSVSLRSIGQHPNAQSDVYVADTVGELGLIYRLAPIVFMGGSLVPHGGQNPIEAAKLGTAILHGPHVWNFTDIYSALDEAHGAVPVTNAEMLVARLADWLEDNGKRQQAADAARRTVDALGGALERTLEALRPYLVKIRPALRSRDA